MYSRYGFWGMIYMAKCKLYTKLFFRNSRLIRLPFDIRGKEFIGLGHDLTTGKYCRFETIIDKKNTRKKLINFGDRVIINDNVHVAAALSVTIGNDVLIGSKVFISDHNHGVYSGDTGHSSPLTSPNDRPIIGTPVVIEDNVWLGEYVAVLPGVTIGKGSIIGAMSVVSRSIPPYSIAVGAPAKIIKTYNFDLQKWEPVR